MTGVRSQRVFLNTIFLTMLLMHAVGVSAQTYSEKLGFPKDAKVIILHVDDVGMSWDSNEGARKAIETGVSNSLSVMMPCPWVPSVIHYLKDHPDTDAGLHLTLTSEWKEYRWGPLSDKSTTPGLVDNEGAMWPSVELVVQHATPDEVDKEIRAQLQRAKDAGFQPTHLDSHMGTLFATPQFLEKYIKLGIENKIPVMFPGGHNTMIGKQRGADLIAQLQQTGKLIWDAGLPVLDDLHNVSYDFEYPDGHLSKESLQKIATDKYIQSLKELKPGLTMVIMHCTDPSPVFQHISGSGKTRQADLLAMTDPRLKKFLKDQNIILTTWREVMKRRLSVR